MLQMLWVEHKTAAKTFGPTKISIDECSDVDDFLNLLYEWPLPAIPQNTSIILYKPDWITEIDVRDSPSLLGADISRTNPLVVKTTAISNLQHDQESKQLEDSEAYETLDSKNRVWAPLKPTEQGGMGFIEEKLDELKGNRQDLLLSDVAIKLWEKIHFECAYENGPSFEDLKKASEFSGRQDVHDYFRKSAIGQVKKDEIKESFTEG